MDDLFENNKPIKEDGYLTDLITKHAIQFIDRSAQQPFFLEVAYNTPHWPWQPPDHPSVAANHGNMTSPGSDSPESVRATYVAMMERADQGVGQILKELDKYRLGQNTIVIFTNDNGGEWLSRNDPFFHRKDTLWEGGIHVPAIMRWPNHFPRGATNAQVGHMFDLNASILAATTTSVPAEAKPDGMNIFPILEGKAAPVERTLFWRIVTPGRQQKVVRKGDWKLLLDGPQILLYNVKTDLGERTDMAARRQDIVASLRPLIAQWERDVDAGKTPPRGQRGGGRGE